jgi:hypothetical protein
MIAEPSEATMYSPLPTPMISGEPLRAHTSVSGSRVETRNDRVRPVTSRSARLHRGLEVGPVPGS